MKNGYKKLKKECDFYYHKNDKEVIYKDYFKYEFTKKGVLIKALDFTKDDFDWGKEIAELCTEIKKMMLNTIHAFAKINPEEYSKLQKWENITIHEIYQQIKKKYHFNNPKDFWETRCRKVFRKLVTYRDSSARIIRLAAKKREFQVAQAIKKLKKTSTQNINIYFPRLGVLGCAGHANLISNELVNIKKNIFVNLFETFSSNGQTTKKNIFKYERKKLSRINYFEITDITDNNGNARLIKKIKSAKMHIMISHYCFPRLIPKLLKIVSKKSVFFVADSVFANAHKQTHSLIGNLDELSPVSTDLHNPFGALILNKELLKKKQQKDNYSKEYIQHKRRLWIKSALGKKQREVLTKLARNNKWDPVNAIWSFAYCANSKSFIEELHTLLSVLFSPSIDKIPFISGGQQIIIHFIIRDKKFRFACDETLLKMGITVIDENGKSVNSNNNSKLPITVVMYDCLPNIKIEELMTELNGTLVRNCTNKFWIDFPLFITGTSSWGEAISSGSIYLHDGYDGGRPNREIMLDTLIKIFAINDVNGLFSYADLRVMAERQLGKLLMGEDKEREKYLNLDEWAQYSRNNANLLMKFSLVDDILIKLANNNREENLLSSDALVMGDTQES
jgi:hypothetical protein